MDFLSIHGGGGGQRGTGGRLVTSGAGRTRPGAATPRGGGLGIAQTGGGFRGTPTARQEARTRLGRQIAGGRRG